VPAGQELGSSARSPASDVEAGGGSLDVALALARNGDEAGFLELWRELQPRLLRYLRVTDPMSCDDVAAETWLHVVRDLHSFIGDAAGFRAWLFTVARNRAIDFARHRGARPAVPVADMTSVTAASTRSAESEALEQMSTDAAIALVATLPGDQAEMVMLRVVAGLDVAVVARIVEKSPGAVRVAVHRSLRALSRRDGTPAMEVT
jgi:RNA polymerase sigma-70 factor, ECF subfamily